MCYNAIVKDLHFHFPFRRSRLTIEFVGGFCLGKGNNALTLRYNTSAIRREFEHIVILRKHYSEAGWCFFIPKTGVLYERTRYKNKSD